MNQENCEKLAVKHINKSIIMSQGNPIRNPPNQEFFAHLPREIVIDILVRLPIQTIISCKCVCKSWLRLIESPEFGKSHLSKSVPILAMCHEEDWSNVYRIFEIEDRFNRDHLEIFQNPLTEFNFPYRGEIHGSTSGLLFLCDKEQDPHGLYVFNPATRDFITPYCPQEFAFGYCDQNVAYGFGMSKITGRLKLVRICNRGFDCQVYTLGTTRSWRRVAPCARRIYGYNISGAFVNGNLHWLVCDVNNTLWISCFDLETELFSIFSTPTIPNKRRMVKLFALGDSLCLCDHASEDEIIIWSMKAYGDESSWWKEFVISKAAFSPDESDGDESDGYESDGYPCHINILKDGEILIGWQRDVDVSLFYYSKKDAAAREVGMFEPDTFIDYIVHTPSLLSLKSFPMEDVSSF